MFGDLAASFIPGGGGGGKTMGEANAQLDAAISSLVPQWEDIRSKLEAVQTEEEKQFRTNVEKGVQASPLNTIRLFDESNTEDDIRVVFYRDSAGWCPYSMKVWLSVRFCRFCRLPGVSRRRPSILWHSSYSSFLFCDLLVFCFQHTSWKRSASRIV